MRRANIVSPNQRCQTFYPANSREHSALFSRAKAGTLVAASTLGKVGALAESPLAIVASDAVLRAGIGQMLHGCNGTDLFRLRQTASAYVVTAVAGQTLARAVLGVAKTHAVSARRSRSRRVGAKLMTGTT